MADWKLVRFCPTYAEPIDPEILSLCDTMNTAGFETTQSCCGHGVDWPRVWFKHSTDERIEKMARFVKQREWGNYRPFSTTFQKEILDEGYLWMLEIHLNNVYCDTPADIGLKEATNALEKVTSAIRDWNTLNEN